MVCSDGVDATIGGGKGLAKGLAVSSTFDSGVALYQATKGIIVLLCEEEVCHGGFKGYKGITRGEE